MNRYPQEYMELKPYNKHSFPLNLDYIPRGIDVIAAKLAATPFPYLFLEQEFTLENGEYKASNPVSESFVQFNSQENSLNALVFNQSEIVEFSYVIKNIEDFLNSFDLDEKSKFQNIINIIHRDMSEGSLLNLSSAFINFEHYSSTWKYPFSVMVDNVSIEMELAEAERALKVFNYQIIPILPEDNNFYQTSEGTQIYQNQIVDDLIKAKSTILYFNVEDKSVYRSYTETVNHFIQNGAGVYFSRGIK